MWANRLAAAHLGTAFADSRGTHWLSETRLKEHNSRYHQTFHGQAETSERSAARPVTARASLGRGSCFRAQLMHYASGLPATDSPSANIDLKSNGANQSRHI
ncbi:hypothetical protein TREES_T100019276 [Tupaia chinensis]|uniref:Uncharacterized protein n=1 Tax=Tupaia chinensis TaxID=246437 RepID=L9L4S0_TUPCH|nr:hypothetical protein TREES_T100019276 [Tupaia chinensis]